MNPEYMHSNQRFLHHTKKGFCNPHIDNDKKTLLEIVKWRFERKKKDKIRKLRSEVPQIKTNVSKLQQPPAAPQITWFGHSSVLIQYKNVNILTDPIFSLRPSPVQFIGPKRYSLPPLPLESVPKIDYILISHNHYDHLDLATVRYFANSVHWIVPLGLKTWFKKRGIHTVTEFDWWQSLTIADTTFYCTPCQHWSKRSVMDTFKTLWCSWAVKIDDFKFWFGGDTGYNDIHFKQIGNTFSSFDFAAIPIGAYSPRWFMQAYHVNPEEALQIHCDVRSEKSLGIHWGTFALADEPPGEPPEALKQAIHNYGYSEKIFTTWAVGETRIL